MADPFASWGSSSSAAASPFASWGSHSAGAAGPFAGWGGAYHYSSSVDSGGAKHNSGLWPDFLSDNPVSEAIGSVGDIGGRTLRQAKQFATHDLWSGLWAAGRIGWHDLSGGKVADPRENSFSYLFSHPIGYAELYLHDPNVFGGGIITPLAESYRKKYLSTDVLHHIAQDPFGTVLDASVLGKAAGVAHVGALTRAAEAGRITEAANPIRFGLSDLGHRTVELKPYGDAPGITVDLSRASTSHGRLIQGFLDEQRSKLPPGVPFSDARKVGAAMRRMREAEFTRYQQESRAAQLEAAGLPANEARAIPLIAELPKWSADPLADLHRLYEGELRSRVEARDAWKAQNEELAAAGEAVRPMPKGLDAAVDESLKLTLKELESIPPEAIYNPSPRLLRAVELTRKAQATLNAHLVNREILDPERIHNRIYQTHRMMGGTRFVEKQTETVRVTDDAGKAKVATAKTDMVEPRKRLTKANERVRATERSLSTANKPLPQQYGEYMQRNKSLGRTPKSYRQWAEEVAPKREAQTEAIAKHQTALAEQRAAQKAYNDARERWHAAKGNVKAAKRETRPVADTGKFTGGPDVEEMARAEEDALHSYATGGSLHGPLAQYGPSFRRPHISSVDTPSAYTRARLVLARKGLDDAWHKGKGANWLRGQVAMHPDAFTVDTLRQYRWLATDDAFDQWVIPLSGELDPELAEFGGRTRDEYYVRTQAGTQISGSAHRAAAALDERHQALEDDKLYAEAQNARVFRDLPADLAKRADEDSFAHFNRLRAAGVRRLPADIADLWRRETGGTNALFRLVVRNGVNQAWRFMLLGIKPAWAVANAMTNEMLVTLKYAGLGGGRALLNLVRSTRGERGVRQLGMFTVKMPLGPSEVRAVIAEFFPELRSGSFQKQLDRQIQHAGSLKREGDRSLPVKAVRTVAKWGSGVGILGKVRDFNEGFNQWAEDFARDQAALVEIKQFTGKWADTADELRAQLEELSKDPKAIDKVVAGVEDILGNYSNLSRMEREWIVTVAPFYPWFKTIIGITARFTLKHPERLWALHAIAQGLSATANSNFQLGIPVPAFGASLLPLFGPDQGQQEVLTLRASNPFQTPADIADVVFALAGNSNATPGESGLSLLGPVAQAGFVTLSGLDPYFGGQYRGPGDKSGRLAMGLGSLLNLPQERLYEQLSHGYKSKVYNSPTDSSPIPGVDEGQYLAILQYLGIPVRQVNLANMAQRAREEGVTRPGETP